MDHPRLGVCSWSLQPGSPGELTDRVRRCGVNAVQLALDPLRVGSWDEARTASALADAKIAVLSGMMTTKGEDYSTLDTIRRTGGVRPDEHWPDNLAAARANAAIAERLGLSLVTFHAGFLPHDPRDPERATMRRRLTEIAAIFADHGIATALETGQESAETLIGVLRELAHPSVGVNFDPANMILYGMGDPIAALRELLPWVRQVHIKDALPASSPGDWGTEVPVGRGAVRWPEFFDVLRGAIRPVNLLIEREAGTSRVDDVRTATELIRQLAPTWISPTRS